MKKTYFYRVNKEDIWYRAEFAEDTVNWHGCDLEEVVELQPDGSGKYKRCREMPIKEDCFYKIPETMTMIALKASPVAFYDLKQ
jgi:hypothetical protein